MEHPHILCLVPTLSCVDVPYRYPYLVQRTFKLRRRSRPRPSSDGDHDDGGGGGEGDGMMRRDDGGTEQLTRGFYAGNAPLPLFSLQLVSFYILQKRGGHLHMPSAKILVFRHNYK